MPDLNFTIQNPDQVVEFGPKKPPIPATELDRSVTLAYALGEGADKFRDTYKSSNANFALVNQLREGCELDVRTDMPCHNDMRQCGQNTGHIISHIKGDYSNTHKDFYDWLLNRSVVADVFATKEILDGNIIVVSTDFPANMVAWALISSRAPWEKSAAIKRWRGFVKAGMKEDAAYFFCNKFVANSNGVYYSTFSHEQFALPASQTVDELKNILDRNFAGALGGTMNTNPTYDSGSGVYYLFKDRKKSNQTPVHQVFNTETKAKDINAGSSFRSDMKKGYRTYKGLVKGLAKPLREKYGVEIMQCVG